MTELSFLIDLLLNHKLPKATRDAVAERIRDVEVAAPVRPHMPVIPQALSSRDVAARHPEVAPEPVAVVAQNATTQAALASRQQAIAESMAGKVDKTTGRPRKF